MPSTPALAVEAALPEVAPVAKLASQHAKAQKRHVRLHRTRAKLRGGEVKRTRAEIQDWSLDHLQTANRRLKMRNAKLRARVAGPSVAVPGHLQAIAACESGGNPAAIGGGGLYRGKYQFDLQTWASVGGSGDPAAAPEAEQDRRAAILYAKAGASPWPVCG